MPMFRTARSSRWIVCWRVEVSCCTVTSFQNRLVSAEPDFGVPAPARRSCADFRSSACWRRRVVRSLGCVAVGVGAGGGTPVMVTGRGVAEEGGVVWRHFWRGGRRGEGRVRWVEWRGRGRVAVSRFMMVERVTV